MTGFGTMTFGNLHVFGGEKARDDRPRRRATPKGAVYTAVPPRDTMTSFSMMLTKLIMTAGRRVVKAEASGGRLRLALTLGLCSSPRRLVPTLIARAKIASRLLSAATVKLTCANSDASTLFMLLSLDRRTAREEIRAGNKANVHCNLKGLQGRPTKCMTMNVASRYHLRLQGVRRLARGRLFMPSVPTQAMIMD